MSSSPTERIGSLIWPPRLAGRISRLLALGLVLLLAICLAALRQLSLQPGSDQIADLLAAHVAALRAMPGDAVPGIPAGPGSPLLEVGRAAQPPDSAVRPMLPFSRRLVERLEFRLGQGADVRIEEAERSWLWVAPARAGEPWLAVPLPPFRQQATVLTLVVVGCALLMVLVGGIVLSQQLTRPLARLAGAAPALAAGELAEPPVDAGAPQEVRELAAALQRAALDVRERTRQRALMLAGLSHDLRTPLARLRYALALSPSADATLHAQMEADLEELDALVGLFLDLGRGGRLREGSVDIPVADFLNTLLERVSEQAWQVEAPSLLVVHAPPLALRRLLANLLVNAERHGAPPFLVSAGSAEDGVWIEVIDHGPGIPAHEHERLLRPFERGAARGEGSGLGLSIASQLAEGMGGRLRLHEAAPAGLRVRLSGLRAGAKGAGAAIRLG